METRNDEGVTTLEFHIGNIQDEDLMKSIPHSALPTFHGLYSEYLDEYLLEFNILYQSYDSISSAQNLKLFPTTLKRIH